jgi:type IV pilus modification protein PilV
MNTALRHRRCNSRQGGFTLIEVLIAGLVLSVGVLGVAGLQVTALKNLQSSQSYGVAAMLANDIADRMWVNQTEALANNYNHTAAPEAPPDCVTGVCTTAQIASFDINDWQEQIVGYTLLDDTAIPGLLPSGSGTVELSPVQPAVGTSFDIILRWDDDRSGSADTTCPAVDADDLDCYTLTITF